jgi:hypothetical protein
MRGGPLKNRQLVGFDRQSVTFSYRDHRDMAASGGASMPRTRLPVSACIRRVLQHVVPVKMHVVRLYGLYHASKAALLVPLRAEVGQSPAVVFETPSWQEVCARRGDLHPERCPVCGQALVCTGTVARRVGPGPPEVVIGRVA